MSTNATTIIKIYISINKLALFYVGHIKGVNLPSLKWPKGIG